jgi:hypothetical protein
MKLTNSMELSTTREALDVRPLDSFSAFHGTRSFNTEFTRALQLRDTIQKFPLLTEEDQDKIPNTQYVSRVGMKTSRIQVRKEPYLHSSLLGRIFCSLIYIRVKFRKYWIHCV